jgi:hypothetical protein
MHGILRMVAMLLLLTMMAGLPAAQAMPVPLAHAAGCHSHRPETPSPAPISYQCCVNGHHAAVPIVSFALHFALAEVISSDGVDGPSLALLLGVNSAPSIFPSASPPGVAPLRI